jgi:hypothetical protein
MFVPYRPQLFYENSSVASTEGNGRHLVDEAGGSRNAVNHDLIRGCGAAIDGD